MFSRILRATLDAAHQAMKGAVDYYRREEGYIVIARQPFSVFLSKYVVELDFFVELTLAVEYSEPVPHSLFSVN